MARHERDFRSDAEAPLSLDELFALLGADGNGEALTRGDMIACALSASEGWQDAVRKLGGAFADEEAGLKERKGE